MIETLIAHLPMVICLLLGMGLIVVEVFLPGFGLPGISGIVLIGIGIALAYTHAGTLVAAGILLVIIAVLAVLISWVLRSAARGSVGRSELFLKDREELHKQADMAVLVGKQGKTLSVLRPAGIGDFDGVRLNVVTEGGFIDSGRPIEIVEATGTRIVVRERKTEEEQSDRQ